MLYETQLLNQQQNIDCHFPRANKLKCVMFTPPATPNGNAVCLFEEPDLATLASFLFITTINELFEKSFMCNSI